MKNRSAFFYIIIILALLAVAGLVFLLAPGNEPETPAVLLPTPVPADTVTETPDISAGAEVLSVTPETVQTVIRTLQRSGSYSRRLYVCDYWSGGSRNRTIDVWVRGNDLRLTVQTEGSPIQECLLLRDNEKWTWYSDEPSSVFHSAAPSDNTDAYQSIMTYEKVLQHPVTDILDAGYTDFSDISCIFVRFRSGRLNYESECFIDPSTGLLMGERCYDHGVLIYTMDSSEPEISTPDDTVFAIP